MMIILYSVLALMTLIALGFVLWPQLRQGGLSRWHVALVSLLLIVAVGMYGRLGAYEKLAELGKLKKLDQVILQLERHLSHNPDGHGWYLLGRLYLNKQWLQAALAAFVKAKELSPDKPEIVLAYADTLHALAVDAYQQQNYQQAIDYWQRLLPQLDANTPAEKNVRNWIASAQQYLR